jgi:hypothetical protein
VSLRGKIGYYLVAPISLYQAIAMAVRTIPANYRWVRDSDRDLILRMERKR